jgi:hypothetical protein
MPAPAAALSTCLFLGAVMDILGALGSSILGIQIAPTFNQPWLVRPPTLPLIGLLNAVRASCAPPLYH